MRIRTEKSDIFSTVYASGGIDAMTCSRLAGALNALIDGGETRIILDLGKTDYISSAGLRVILFAAKRLYGAGRFVISTAEGHVGDILALAGISDVIDVYPAPESARAAIGSPSDGC